MLVFLIWLLGPLAVAQTSICHSVFITGLNLKLSQNEKILICGTNDDSAWGEVPLSQAQYQLKVLLQNKGYLNPSFERRNNQLFVNVNAQTQTENLIIQGALLNPNKKRKIIGYPLEPKKLDEVKQWAEVELRRQGYACPQIEVEASDRNIHLQIQPGQKGYYTTIERRGFESLTDSVPLRFEAYKLGQPFEAFDSQITVNRLLNHGLFQSAFTNLKCVNNTVSLKLVAGVGKPRLVRFGVGASTEEIAFTEVLFRDTKLDNKASTFSASARASVIRQELKLDSQFFILPVITKSYLGPHLLVERRKERTYEIARTQVGADIGYDFDFMDYRFQARGGPLFNYEKTFTGVGPRDSKFISIGADLKFSSHNYEALLRQQFEGLTGELNYQGQREGIGSSINVDRYDITLKHLWNIHGFSPPLFVFATRFELTLVDSADIDRAVNSDILPIDYRVFYGGDANLRGFSRESINNNGLGFLSALQLGFELRLVEELPYGLEPFLLYDLSRVGDERYKLLPSTLVSTGLGLRWASPFGTLRFSAAQGQIWNMTPELENVHQGLVINVSFGQEF